MVGADEPDDEPVEPAILGLGDPRRPGEVLEPEAREQRPHPAAAAPPLVDDVDDGGIVGLGGPAEAHVAAAFDGHRAATQATTTAMIACAGTSGPKTSPR